ncbi:hypothetical protein CPB84DRAFT_1784770 [Gymnopilus junonius]|uniref:Uncharacterized protein n=1 Tax=Gymnopilus junonius TaxID=109634 RepID=A0A9P5NLA0_GYMJU|nr:hypothetical protein CPB84DRAFT_1784770 [Gymnopilus junonius]
MDTRTWTIRSKSILSSLSFALIMTSNDIIHLTSQRAASQKRNIFIWCGCSDTVSISFRGDLNVTERRIYTWVDIIIKEDLTGILSRESLQYSIFPVTVEPSRGEILCYQASPKTPLNPLSRVSDSAVEPGDYGIYATGKLYVFVVHVELLTTRVTQMAPSHLTSTNLLP